MRSSDISSGKTNRVPPAAESPRKSFALTGRSVTLDPLRHAVRPDLADIRLAERVFAPHYAAPMPCVVVADATLRAESTSASEALSELRPGEPFDCLEVLREVAWGFAPERDMAGYVDREALDRAS